MSTSSAPSDTPSLTQPTFTGTFSTPTALSTESPTPTPSQTSLTSSAALYPTLVLLLAVSSAIVIRSLILRRRHQRLVEEAIRAGTWVPHQFGPEGRRRRDIGEKPRMWDAWIQNTHDEEGGGGGGNEKGNWDDIMPVCAARTDNQPSSSSTKSTSPPATEPHAEPQARPSRFLRPFYRRPTQHSPQPDTILPMTERQPLSSHSSPSRSPPSPAAATAVRVAVLIAMPSPPQHAHHKPDEDGPPVVELGVVEVGLREEGGDSVGP
ncbi:hypothetical protein F5I97DRAFT_1931153 [Phlebopus sp. FC_14]|nr:hypothetical protein F5I97DRAFT_1931153 [Phlebopus sp. FC_14]